MAVTMSREGLRMSIEPNQQEQDEVRHTIRMPAKTFRVYERVADLLGVGVGALLRDVLISGEPAMERMAEAFGQIMAGQEAAGMATYRQLVETLVEQAAKHHSAGTVEDLAALDEGEPIEDEP